jgi:hypothetical protein
MGLAVSVHTSLVGQCHVHKARLVYFLYLMIYFRLQWWAEASDDVLNRLKESRADDFNRMMRDEWEGEFGDRRQELVFIGAGMDKEVGTPPSFQFPAIFFGLWADSFSRRVPFPLVISLSN